MSGVDAERTGRLAWVVWAAALACYVLGVFHRSSLAVAGLEAADRFGISATQLGGFVVLQLAVYAVLQVPVGLLVDRFGPRVVLLVGVALMSVGQLVFAFADSYLLAVVARVLVGAGDASTFVCVLRVIVAWFRPRRVPLITQLAGPTGQVGTIAAAVPMAWALHTWGWERTYLAAAGLGIALAIVVLLVVRDEPGRRTVRGSSQPWRAVASGLRASWAVRETRLGFWVHFSQHFSSTLLALVWGYPYFVLAHGVSATTAGTLITVMIVAVISAGPLVGWLVGARPDLRIPVALGSIALVAVVWAVVLVWPGGAPTWVLVPFVVVVGATGPVAMIGFDLVRTAHPPERLGSASGLVNQGGFVASLLVIFAVGLLLDLQTDGSSTDFSAAAFRVAMSVQYVLWGLAAVQILRLSRARSVPSLLASPLERSTE
ncbi:MFS transporter [Nocardioides zeae]|uniref:Lysosomal dipeptide transporter MFSD1 n=1 Tax=Nocardioides zeae TaxID=1457234 RepID=A0A6P0HKK8_9ACTN|nr:MFS transporter [Nocardioides zeae]NEN79141.1 MFS transporter [Nocardioides zeae]